ncbi:TPA: regulator [Klebsiella variicola]
MSALMNLLKKGQAVAESAKNNRGNDLIKMKPGENYLRIILNKDDPENAPFFHKYGIHYAKTKGEDGKDVYSAHLCAQHTHDKPCEMCEMVMEAKAKHKGNKPMEKVIDEMRANARMAVVGMLSQREDFSDVEKTGLVDMPMSVFEDLLDQITQDINDEIGNPLDRQKGYAYQITRSGTGLDTEYKVKPMRKNKTEVLAKFWDNQPSLESFVNQNDATKLMATSKMIARATGVALPASLGSSAGSLPSPTGGAAASLPGMSGSITGVDDSTEEASLLEKEIAHAKDVVFEPTAEKSVATEAAAEEPESEDTDDIDDIYAQLNSLSM